LITIYGRSHGDGEKGDTQIKVINGYSTSIGLLKVQGIGSSKQRDKTSPILRLPNPPAFNV
jgi:hypothetical protein